MFVLLVSIFIAACMQGKIIGDGRFKMLVLSAINMTGNVCMLFENYSLKLGLNFHSVTSTTS